jgi:hypothetical protein
MRGPTDLGLSNHTRLRVHTGDRCPEGSACGLFRPCRSVAESYDGGCPPRVARLSNADNDTLSLAQEIVYCAGPRGTSGEPTARRHLYAHAMSSLRLGYLIWTTGPRSNTWFARRAVSPTRRIPAIKGDSRSESPRRRLQEAPDGSALDANARSFPNSRRLLVEWIDAWLVGCWRRPRLLGSLTAQHITSLDGALESRGS